MKTDITQTITESTAPPRWKVGLYIWRVDKEWRIRLYRPWRRNRIIEIQSTDFIWALYILGIGAGWWEGIDRA